MTDFTAQRKAKKFSTELAEETAASQDSAVSQQDETAAQTEDGNAMFQAWQKAMDGQDSEEKNDSPEKEEATASEDISDENNDEEIADEEGEIEEEEEDESSPFSGNFSFTYMEEDSNVMEFAGEWNPAMEAPSYIGETDMLLSYLRKLERKYKVSMPIKACGIDPLLFENVTYYPDAEEQKFFEIPADSDANDAKAPSLYQLIRVDGELYLSCTTESIDPEYLRNVIAEASAAIRQHSTYTFAMTGFRKLHACDGNQASMFYTLRMNTYELSALISYMLKFEGMHVSYEERDGLQYMIFTVR